MADATLRTVAAMVAVVATFILAGLFAALIVVSRRINSRRGAEDDKA
jgi:hypothetical protein